LLKKQNSEKWPVLRGLRRKNDEKKRKFDCLRGGGSQHRSGHQVKREDAGCVPMIEWVGGDTEGVRVGARAPPPPKTHQRENNPTQTNLGKRTERPQPIKGEINEGGFGPLIGGRKD